MLHGLTAKFLDDECVSQCFAQMSKGDDGDLTEVTINDPSLLENSGSDFCIKSETTPFNCKDPTVAEWDE